VPRILETVDVDKTFGAIVAASSINIAVDAGEVVGIIGANGAGKTTFVNLVTGYLKPDGGRILYAGTDITSHQPREIAGRGIRRSFQIPQLFPGLTVLDNVLVALSVVRSGGVSPWHNVHNSRNTKAAADILDRYGISDYRDQTATTLPQGVRKLLDIALATVGDFQLILLDEPTSGISVDEKFTIMDMLMAALGTLGATILFVEHDMEIVERYAERVAAFYDGRIIADGTPKAVLSDDQVRQYVVGSELHRRSHKGKSV
jgi:branched-chain amino acid transport system ATP-binding protein